MSQADGSNLQIHCACTETLALEILEGLHGEVIKGKNGQPAESFYASLKSGVGLELLTPRSLPVDKR